MSSEWISAKDKLPEYNGLFLVYTTYKFQAVTSFSEHKGWHLDQVGKDSRPMPNEVTHWMELPLSPYEQEMMNKEKMNILSGIEKK